MKTYPRNSLPIRSSVVRPVLRTLLLLFLVAPALPARSGDRLSALQALPDSRDFEARYDEARRAFLDEFHELKEEIPEGDLQPTTRLYDIAQGRARDGQFESALQLMQKAKVVLRQAYNQHAGNGAAADSLKDMVERQFARLKEVLADSEQALRNAGAEGNRGLLQQAYSEADKARQAIRDSEWRVALNGIARAMELARNAVRNTRGVAADGKLPAEELNKRLESALESMDLLLAEASDRVVSGGAEDEDAVEILEQARNAASRARKARDEGHPEEAFRRAHRAIELSRIALVLSLGASGAGSRQVQDELKKLSGLLNRAEEILRDKEVPTAAYLLQQAQRLQTQALDVLENPNANGDGLREALQLTRAATESVTRAIQLAAPMISQGPEKALRDFRSRYLSRARDLLRETPNDQAEERLVRAEELADQAERQIRDGRPLEGLATLRIATEMAIQALKALSTVRAAR